MYGASIMRAVAASVWILIAALAGGASAAESRFYERFDAGQSQDSLTWVLTLGSDGAWTGVLAGGEYVLGTLYGFDPHQRTSWAFVPSAAAQRQDGAGT